MKKKQPKRQNQPNRQSQPQPRVQVPRVGLISLGCPKNLVDSEVMAGYLVEKGFDFTGDPEEAEVIIVNTCSFIGPAIEEAKQSLREMIQLKEEGNCLALICAGCLPQREGEALVAEFPEVDAFLGVDQIPQVAEIAAQLLGVQEGIELPRTIGKATYLYDDTAPRLLTTPPWTAYVKVAEGCLHRCSFCTIPAIRGDFRSRQIDSVVREVEDLVNTGVGEIVLTAQDTTAYGRDIGTSLAALLRELDKIEELHWLRLMYGYPGEITDELLEIMRSSSKICNYLDIPLQHAHPRILREMHRPGSAEEYLALIAKLRAAMPEIALRSAFIVGFPGETEAEFQTLLDFLGQAQLDRVGAFVYCREPGTKAAELDGQVPEEVAQERFHRLMALQQQISLQRNQLCIGKKLEVVIEGEADEGLIGRTFRDAPEIDGEVVLELPPQRFMPGDGDFVMAEITGASEYDLTGRLADLPPAPANVDSRKK